MSKKSQPQHPNGPIDCGANFVTPGMVAPLTRRGLLQTGVSLWAFMTMNQFFGSDRALAQSTTVQRRLIWINMSGGWDILEVTDPKPSSTSGIDMSFSWDQARNLAGADDAVRIGRFLPKLGLHGEQIVVVRGIAMGTTSHMAGSIYMDTGVLSNAGRVNAASIPAIVASESQATIPIIQLNGGSEPMTDRGLLNPVSVVRAENLALYRSMYPSTDGETAVRTKVLDYLKSSVDRLAAQVGSNDRLNAISAAESKIRGQISGRVAEKLSLTSEDLAPYLADAPTGMNNGMAQSFALAGKLIKNNLVTCVNLGIGGFDTHANQEPRLQPILLGFDHVLSALIDDLQQAGALDSTLIVCYSDFGRTPRINNSNGRDHWPVGGSLLIGGGIAGGRVVGGTDDNLLALACNSSTGAVESGGTQLSPAHLGGAVLELCLGSSYNYRSAYLTPIPALTRLRS
jgi:hypothetical protein